MAYLYIIAEKTAELDARPVKIGISASPEDRVEALQTGNWRKLQVCSALKVGSLPIAAYFEDWAHQHFQATRITGEWFDVSASEAKAIIGAKIASEGACPALPPRHKLDRGGRWRGFNGRWARSVRDQPTLAVSADPNVTASADPILTTPADPAVPSEQYHGFGLPD